MTLEEYLSRGRDPRYITTDSRSVFDPSNTVFAAIKTDLADGHRYAGDMYRCGVRTFIVEELPQDAHSDAEYIVVGNVPDALAGIARARLEDIHSGVIITGSIGKTTMKELLYTALLPYEDVRRSPRSWNSSIGVPLAVCDMTRSDNHGAHILTEAGIDAPGQGAPLSAMLGPSHGMAIITPVTEEHDEAFASHVMKVAEKLAVVKGASIIIYADTDAELRRRLEDKKSTDRSLRLYPVQQGRFPSIYHALADKAMELMGYDEEKRRAVRSLPLADKRREIAAGSYGNTIYRDGFTADVRSLQEALDFMRRHATPSRPKVLVLGELIDREPEEDAAQAVALANKFGIDKMEHVCPELLARIHSGEELRDSQVLLFGRQTPLMTNIAEALESAGHDTILEVDLDAIAHNYNYFRSLVPKGTGIVAMVKASAYGLGSIEIGKTLQSLGAAYLAVAVIEEGIALREAGITMPIMVLNPVTNRYPALFSHQLEPAVFAPDELSALISEAKAFGVKDYPVHIKFDTGMHRVGFLASQLPEIAKMLSATDAVKVSSAFSHLAAADCIDMDSYTREQLSLFYEMTGSLRELIGYDFKRHILNTAGMMRFADAGTYEMGRLGIGLYGVSPYPGPEAANLRTVASFRSHIISLKEWPEDTPIGYGCKGHTAHDTTLVATVPVGYADGVNRRLGYGNASFIVNGAECPTLGSICMDLCMIDVSAAHGVKVGDSVEIFGTAQPVERLAETLGTIPYELLTWVSQRVRRVYVKR